MIDHGYWEELAAGHALDALEPPEVSSFVAHLAGCRPCQAAVDGHTFVAAQLGTLAADEAPSWDWIRSGILPGPTVTSLDVARDRRRTSRWVGAAAALVLVAGGAIAWQATRSDEGPSAQQVALSSCTRQVGCHVVQLQGKGTLVLSDRTARLLPSRLGPPPGGRVYVLWQLARDGSPALVGTLTTTTDGSVGETHPLPLSYEDTAAFGLSLERAGTVPTRPSEVVAVGSA